MSVLFIAVPLALVLVGAAVVAFVRSVRTGQFDDLRTPPMRILFEDGEATQRPKSKTHRNGDDDS